MIVVEVFRSFAGAYQDGEDRMTESGHLSKDSRERYALSRATEAECAEVEEHLLICALCRTRLTEMESYHKAMSSALKVAASFPAQRPIEIVHYTAEGPVYSSSRKVKPGRWL